MAWYELELERLSEDFYDSFDDIVEEIWRSKKMKWFFPWHRKKKIKEVVFLQHLFERELFKYTYIIKELSER